MKNTFLNQNSFNAIASNEAKASKIKGALSAMHTHNTDFKNSKHRTNFLPKTTQDGNVSSLFFNSKIEHNEEIIDEFKNSKGISGSGLAPMVSLLARQLGFTVSQKYYEGKEKVYTRAADSNLVANESETHIEDIVPTEAQPKYAFMPTAYYMLEKDNISLNADNLGRGYTNEFGATPQTDGNKIGYEYANKTVATKGRALEYSFNQLEFERDRLLGLDGLTKSVELIKKQAELERAHLTMSGSADIGEKGLLNCDALIDVDSTNASATNNGFVANKTLDQYTKAELEVLAVSLKRIASGSLAGYGSEWKEPVMVVDRNTFININRPHLIDFPNYRVSVAQYLLAASGFSKIISSRSAIANDTFNPHGNKNIIQLMDLSKDVIFMYDIIPFSLYATGNSQGGLFTGNGVDLKATFIEQHVFPYVINKQRIIRIKI